MELSIDLNADLGEGMPDDEALMAFISSANIACGGHAGDADSMRRAVDACLHHQVSIGAHPSFPDREGFGRQYMQLSAAELTEVLMEQLSALQKVCEAAGTRLHHVKPHGALYNQSAADETVANSIAAAIRQFDDSLWLVGLAGSVSIAAAEAQGLRTIHEFFADRTYQPDGTLTPRSQPHALVHNADTAVQQAMRMAVQRQVLCVDGTILAPMLPTGMASICLHGDGPHALDFAERIALAFRQVGGQIVAP